MKFHRKSLVLRIYGEIFVVKILLHVAAARRNPSWSPDPGGGGGFWQKVSSYDINIESNWKNSSVLFISLFTVTSGI